MRKFSKEDTLKKWDSILGNMGISEDKKDCMSQYAELQSNNEITPVSQHNFGSLLPIAMKVASKTIAQDLVPVQPMGGGNSGKEMEKIRSDIKIENRDRKIDSLVEGKDFEEMKNEDHPDYIKPKGPLGLLFYLDFVYGSTSSTI
jgi:hypothetical protein